MIEKNIAKGTKESVSSTEPYIISSQDLKVPRIEAFKDLSESIRTQLELYLLKFLIITIKNTLTN